MIKLAIFWSGAQLTFANLVVNGSQFGPTDETYDAPAEPDLDGLFAAKPNNPPPPATPPSGAASTLRVLFIVPKSADGTYDVDVSVTTANGPAAKLAIALKDEGINRQKVVASKPTLGMGEVLTVHEKRVAVS